ncbi:unnamed protein product (macronuclear) [Paramecium tetraurelia]|uniref:FHA domain-containing protein n=1 Tax=Paramecium tetraurelia TaxID=5888 RepID=A0C6Y9_PARTE|nr:uncharacterized protein GSPATT00035685001 [Paramecium tetraurelia]CAK66556.1 unnamed protein product [Paramecium tetraurelia]|eukprot:XP_001433953.1 hypothetical protein (macronuclear) [Paramecium tetraurelia strain d4-2]
MGELIVTITTWDKPNYELFDGESQNYRIQEYLINEPGIFCRNGENETFFDQNLSRKDGVRTLFNVRIDDGQFVIGDKDKIEDLWIQSKNEQQIRQNDVIKLGKKVLKVLSISNENNLHLTHYQNVASQIENVEASLFESSNMCRICLGHTCNTSNPLLSLCRCCGSTKYVHYDCLKTWLFGKMQAKQTQYCTEINAKSVRCEICQSFYPSIVYTGTSVLALYNLENLKYHVVLEDIENQTILVLNFKDLTTLTVGRGHESNVKISEITISRTHLAFVVRNEKLYIEDKNSKFGTLIKLQKARRIEKNETLFLQSGRSRIMIKHKAKPKRCALLCNFLE